LKGAITLLLALGALAPAALGSAASATRDEMTLALCSGGSLTIPIGGGQNAPDEDGDGCAKGCHAGCSRKRIDRAQ